MLHFHVNVFGHPFAITWEQAAKSLRALPAMIFELDGSWVWTGETGDSRWQVDGHLFDFHDRLHRVELHGQCPAESLDQLLACFGWPLTQLSFEQIREGVTLDESEFRQRGIAQ